MGKFSLLTWVRGIDIFGYPFSLNFRGDDSRKSLLGAMLTLFVHGFTITVALVKAAEITSMADPEITVYDRTFSQAEMEEFAVEGQTFADFGFNLGMSFTATNWVDGWEPAFPPEMGRLVARHMRDRKGVENDFEEIDLVNCLDAIEDFEGLTESVQEL